MMNKLQGKRLLILGGIALSCEIVKAAKDMGVYTMVTDYLPDSPAKKIADASFMVSTTDVDALEQLCREQHVDGVLTGYIDLLLPYAEELCRRLNLPFYATAEQLHITMDKRTFKDTCRHYQVPVVEEYEFQPGITPDETLHYPLLVKPIDSSGGRGITICYNREQLEKAYEYALTFSAKKEVLVERFVIGEEATAFYAMSDGDVILTGMGDRHIRNLADSSIISLPVGYTYPSLYLDGYLRDVDPYIKEMLHGLGMKNGMMFVQMMVEDGKFLVYEVGYRLTGTVEHHMLRDGSGFDPVRALIHYALTGSMGEPAPSLATRPDGAWYGNNTFYCNPCTLDHFGGLDEIAAMDGVLSIVQSYWPSDTIAEKARGTLGQVVFRILTRSDTKAHLAALMDTIVNTLQIYDTHGNNVCLPSFEATAFFKEKNAL